MLIHMIWSMTHFDLEPVCMSLKIQLLTSGWTVRNIYLNLLSSFLLPVILFMLWKSQKGCSSVKMILYHKPVKEFIFCNNQTAHRISVEGTREMLSSWLAYKRTPKTKCQPFSYCCRIAPCDRTDSINRGQTETAFESLVVYFLSLSPHSAGSEQKVMKLWSCSTSGGFLYHMSYSPALLLLAPISDLHWMNQTSVSRSIKPHDSSSDEYWRNCLSYSYSQLQETVIRQGSIKKVMKCNLWFQMVAAADRLMFDGHQQTLNIFCLVCLQKVKPGNLFILSRPLSVTWCVSFGHIVDKPPWNTCNQVMWGRFLPPAQDTYSVKCKLWD